MEVEASLLVETDAVRYSEQGMQQTEDAAMTAFSDEELARLSKNPQHDISDLAREVLNLRQWIREEADHSNVCVYNVLHEVCSGCKCHKKAALAEGK